MDRDPPKAGEAVTVLARAATYVVARCSASADVSMGKYPDPPQAFRTTPEVQLAYRRWAGFREGKEPLPSMAYFVLTLLESAAGNRKAAATTFNVDLSILETLGRLSSTKGNEQSARKIRRGVGLQELSPSEKNWMEQIVRRLIWRMGEHASGAPLPRIRMADFPPP